MAIRRWEWQRCIEIGGRWCRHAHCTADAACPQRPRHLLHFPGLRPLSANHGRDEATPRCRVPVFLCPGAEARASNKVMSVCAEVGRNCALAAARCPSSTPSRVETRQQATNAVEPPPAHCVPASSHIPLEGVWQLQEAPRPSSMSEAFSMCHPMRLSEASKAVAGPATSFQHDEPPALQA